jgi:hypothetical protein
MSQVKSLIDAIAHRIPGRSNLYPALNTAVLLIAKRLFIYQSDMITDELDVSVSADTASGDLTTSFWGLTGKPYIDGYTWSLKPLPSKDVKLAYTSNAVPKYYQIKGTTIYLTPGTSSAITIKGDYFKKPTELTKPTDTVPFQGLFDDVIQEFMIKWYSEGSKGDPNAAVLLKAFVNDNVDLLIGKRDKTAAPQIPIAIDWQGLVEDRIFR